MAVRSRICLHLFSISSAVFALSKVAAFQATYLSFCTANSFPSVRCRFPIIFHRDENYRDDDTRDATDDPTSTSSTDIIDALPPQPSSQQSSQTNMTAQDVVIHCMNSMLHNDQPQKNAGLRVCFHYSSDRCHAALGGEIEKFISYASNPTFGSMKNALEYSILSVGPIIQAGKTRGAMQTVLVRVKPANGLEDRTFLW